MRQGFCSGLFLLRQPAAMKPVVVLAALWAVCALMVLVHPTMATTQPFRVIVVHSYTRHNQWTEWQHQGFVQGLSKFGYEPASGKTELTTLELDSRQLFSTNDTLSVIASVALRTISLVCGCRRAMLNHRLDSNV